MLKEIPIAPKQAAQLKHADTQLNLVQAHYDGLLAGILAGSDIEPPAVLKNIKTDSIVIEVPDES